VNVTLTIPKFSPNIVNSLSFQFVAVLNYAHELTKSRHRRGATQKKKPHLSAGSAAKEKLLNWLVTYENSTLLSKRASLFRLGRF
jgi:hypothetical protein